MKLYIITRQDYEEFDILEIWKDGDKAKERREVLLVEHEASWIAFWDHPGSQYIPKYHSWSIDLDEFETND